MVYEIMDLFAGIGGIRLGFERAAEAKGVGMETVFVSEIDKFARETYRANFPFTPPGAYFGDIKGVKEGDFPRVDILVGGFPCQPFSMAGKREGFSDSLGRGELFFEIIRALKASRPLAYFLENVPGLVSHDKGRTFKVVRESLWNAGYTFDYALLSARDFGALQRRKRVYMAGFRADFIEQFYGPVEKWRFEFPVPPAGKGGDGKVLADILLPEDEAEAFALTDGTWEFHRRRDARKRAGDSTFGPQFVTAHSDCIPTIPARYGKDGGNALLLRDGKNPRKLAPREVARSLGFPDSFVFPVSNTQAWKQLGNSVCVCAVQAAAEKVLEVLMF